MKGQASMINIQKVFVGIAVAIFLAGCTKTKPSSFYLLSPIANPSAEKLGSGGARGVALAIGPIELPKHIDRPEIVTFASPNKIKLAEFNRWGEPLADNFARVLADNLALLVPTQRILVHPWRSRAPFEYQVTVEVSNFAVRPSGEASLIARWAIYSKQGKRVLMSWRSKFTRKVRGQGFEAAAAALSELVAQLSQDIANSVKTLPRKGL